MNDTSFSDRISFIHDRQIMEVDFSDMTFDTSAMVDEFYDEVERKILATEQSKWYFLVNYRNTRIFELAWIRFAQRGKRVNIASSLGSVRYAAHEDMEKSIEARAKSEDFDPNLFRSREEAIAEIDRMRASTA
ncbi:MAG: hypothetical protein ACR2QW_09355 [bacterium]